MKNLKLSFIIALLFTSNTIMAQQVGKMTFKAEGAALKKFNNAEKKIYIQHFFVNYQTMMSQFEMARGGSQAGGSYRGNASASLSLGIDGITNNQLQAMTNKFYNEYVAKLEAAGFTIVSAEEVKKNENYADSELVPGGTPSASNIPGYVSTAPEGFIFLNSKNSMFNLDGLPDSKNLGGLIVARVNVTVPFIENGESQGSKALTKSFGGVAKIVLKPNLRISPSETIMMGDFKKPKYMTTATSFAYKKSLKYQASYKGALKKDIEIDGVFEDKKYKAISSASTDFSGSSVGNFTMFNVSDSEIKRMQAVKCDGEKYEKGVTKAISEYLDASVTGFLDFIK